MWLLNFLKAVARAFFIKADEAKDHPMNQDDPKPVTPTPIADKPPVTPAPEPAKPVYLWDTKADARHSVRVICDEEGLSPKQKNDMSSTVNCESGYRTKIVVHNCDLNGEKQSVLHENYVPEKHGRIMTTDYGICQVNDYYHIGAGKTFPSKEYVLNNPDACIRWMARQFKAGHAHLWVCYSKGMYNNYAP